jgi:hypothetical protein
MFRTVPHGTYDLVIEAPAGYLSPPRQEDIVFDQTTADYHKDFALTRVTHTVTVTVDLPEGSDRSLDGAKLVATGSEPNKSITLSGGAEGLTFAQVPFGCWTLQLPADPDHPGALGTMSGGTACGTNGFDVSKDPNDGDVAVSYPLLEQLVNVDVTATPYGSEAAIEQVDIAVTDEDDAVIHSVDGQSVGTPFSVWLAVGTFTVTATPTTGADRGWDPGTREVTVSADDVDSVQDTTVEVKQTPDPQDVTVELTGPSDTTATLPQVTVTVGDKTFSVGPATLSETQQLMPGDYAVSASISEEAEASGWTVSSPSTVTVPINGDASVAATLTYKDPGSGSGSGGGSGSDGSGSSTPSDGPTTSAP